MSKYVDGFLLPIAAENVGKYQEIAQKAGEIWKEHGALEYIEAVGDDLEHEQMVSFNKSADVADGETVILAFIVFESKDHRDKVNAAVMNDPRLKESMGDCKEVFNYKRMAYGGFKEIVNF